MNKKLIKNSKDNRRKNKPSHPIDVHVNLESSKDMSKEKPGDDPNQFLIEPVSAALKKKKM